MKRIAIGMVAILLPVSMNLIYTTSSTDNKAKVKKKVTISNDKNPFSSHDISIKLIY